MGVVYRAYDPHLERDIALKLLFGDSRQAKHLLREAQAMARLSDPSVVQVYDAALADGQVYIAMELIEGETLFRWLQTPRPWSQILDQFLAAGRGLTVAHAAGVVHRDFKPGNVLVSRGGRVLVGDFGLASAPSTSTPAAGTAKGNPLRTQTLCGAGKGTPHYMAPEQRDCAFVDARADQYSFCIAFIEAMNAANAPSHIIDVAGRGLAIEPSARFATMQDLLLSLETARATVLAPPPSAGISNRTAAGVAVAMLGLVFLVGFVSGAPASATARATVEEAPQPIDQEAPERTSPTPAPTPSEVSQIVPPPRATEEPPHTDVQEVLPSPPKAPAQRQKKKSQKRIQAGAAASPKAPVEPEPAPSSDEHEVQDPDGIIRELWASE